MATNCMKLGFAYEAEFLLFIVVFDMAVEAKVKIFNDYLAQRRLSPSYSGAKAHRQAA